MKQFIKDSSMWDKKMYINVKNKEMDIIDLDADNQEDRIMTDLRKEITDRMMAPRPSSRIASDGDSIKSTGRNMITARQRGPSG